jgi:Tol biopolymer transport system component
MKKPTGFLDIVRDKRAAQNVNWSRGPLPEPIDLKSYSDFNLGTWHIDVKGSRIIRGERIFEIDAQTLLAIVLIHEGAADGIRRDILCLHLYGPVRPETHPGKLRRVTSFLRRVLGDDGSVKLLNTENDGYAFAIGDPIEGRTTLEDYDHDAPMRVQSVQRPINPGRTRRRGVALGAAVGVVIALALVLVLLVERREGILYGRVDKTVVFAHEPGRQLAPSFSPDGAQMVYSWIKPDGTQKLYIRNIASGALRQLTDGSGLDGNPLWAPKGGQIAFTRRGPEGCAVMSIAASGGPVRQLGDCEFRSAGQMAWSRDGSALTFAHRTSWEAAGQVVLVNLADGKQFAVTNPSSGMPGDSQPSLATTGRRLAFVRTRIAGADDLQVLEFESGKPVRMTYDLSPINGTAWEQGGHSIILSSTRRGQDALWRIRMDGEPAERLIPSGDPQRRPAVTDDGRHLAFEHWRVTSHFARYGSAADSEGQEFRRGVALERGLSLSANGLVAAYVSNIGDHDAVYLANAPDGVPHPITKGSYDSIETPKVSPDGKRVVFAAVTHGHLDLYLLDIGSGAAETRLTTEGESRAPSWSHVGTTIYFSSTRNGKRWQLYRQRLNGGTAEQLTEEGGLAAQESTDGQWLYFVRPDRKGLWQRSTAPGGDDQFLVGDLAPVDWRNFLVAGDAVWFISRPAGDPTLARYVFAKGRVEPGPLVVGLLADSGLALLPSGRDVVLAEAVDTQVDIELATLE